MAAGGLAALLAGASIAALLVRGRHAPEQSATAPAGALQVQLGEQPKIDPNRQLRCFVGGQFVGPATLAECAKKNGVAAQALDVGLDQSGALAAGDKVPTPTPPPPVAIAAPALPPQPPPPGAAAAPTATSAAAPIGECLRFGPEGWRAAGGGMTLSACVQALFAGHCAQAGEAFYGRWSSQTIRLVPGRVEASPDNRDFHALAAQGRDCSIPPL
jgi:hypothetical protein